MRSTKGFSLLELLIVVAIILIIAAIAIPNLLESKIAANEASAVGSLRAITTSEMTYYNAYPTVGYASAIANLGGTLPCTASSAGACLIDEALSAATPGSAGRNGYYFQATGITTSGLNSNYVIGAAPMQMHSTGNHDYCSMADGVLRSQMGNTGDVPVTQLTPCFAFPVQQ